MGSGWPLTGRVEELRVVTEIIRSPGAGGLVLAGAPGVGKTRLAREALGAAALRGLPVRLVVGTVSAQSVPLGAFAEYATRLGPDPLARVRDVVEALTRTAGADPVVVAIDDAHLLDEQSALVVSQLLRRQVATLVVTVRSGEPAPDAITALWKDELLPRLEVQPLSEVEIARLLEAVLEGPVETSSVGRLWRYTRGNALYLRQLVCDELACSRFVRRSGMWLWDTPLRVSPTLAELIDTTVGRQSAGVLAVLDALAVAEPLELDVLATVTDPAAVNEAEIAGLIRADDDSRPTRARLAHPMFGEVRRARTGTMQLRRLRSTVAAKLPPLADTPDPVSLVRRAVLLLDSDTPAGPDLLTDAAAAALRLRDPTTGERLARAAVELGGGERARRLHMSAMVDCDRTTEALRVNTALIEAAPTERDRVVLTLGRAALLTKNIREIDRAAAELESIRDPASRHGLHRPFGCVAALIEYGRGRFTCAVELASESLDGAGWLNDTFELMGVVGLVGSMLQLGRAEDIGPIVDRGYRLTRSGRETPAPQARFALGFLHLGALWLGGELHAQRRAAAMLAREPMDDASARAHHALYEGMTGLALGGLSTAHKWLRETIAIAGDLETTWIARMAQLLLATAMGMSGASDSARQLLDAPNPVPQLEDQLSLVRARAEGWVRAAEGATSEAIAVVVRGAEHARALNRPAQEVMCLQAAAQFGDASSAPRLVELSAIVQGPRVRAVAAHAAGLAAGDGDGLLAAADRYETFGDRVAAADAAAQAAAVYRQSGRRGAAMTASAFAQRLAAQTGADTPALRTESTPIPLTPRQREIIAFAAAGLTNREIAERLTMSVRTVEGHLFRASRKTGVNSRDELAQLLDDRKPGLSHGS